MAVLLHDIEWSKPFLEPVIDVELERELGGTLRGGRYPELFRMLARRPWIARAMASALGRPRVAFLDPKLYHLVALIGCQENACRFCYGAQRAEMKFIGYQEDDLRKIELDIYEGNERLTALAAFVRTLSKSNPRPAKKELDDLLRAGFDYASAREIVLITAITCFLNRVGTLSAAPPFSYLERLPGSFIGRLFGGTLRKNFTPARAQTTEQYDPSGVMGDLVELLEGIPSGSWTHRTVTDCYASDTISRSTKLMMLGIVARSLGCAYSERRAEAELSNCGVSPARSRKLIDTLGASGLDEIDQAILQWVRKTVHYTPRAIQNETRSLSEKIGPEKTIEAIGTSAVVNMLVRLAMLRQ